MLKSPVSDKGLIKRIIGLPGEEISIKWKKIYIDDGLLEEDYIQHLRPDTILIGDNIEPFVIPEDNYFVMGDNRDVSRDSRDWSDEKGLQTITIHISDIKGKTFSLY